MNPKKQHEVMGYQKSAFKCEERLHKWTVELITQNKSKCAQAHSNTFFKKKMGRKHLQCSVLYSFVITFYKNTKNLKGEQPSETTFQRIFKNKPAHKKYHQKIILKTDAKLFMKIQPTTCLDITLSLKESVDMLYLFQVAIPPYLDMACWTACLFAVYLQK